ncbi:MAG: PHB depolymerase family esterase [Gemmatimonas sp.]
MTTSHVLRLLAVATIVSGAELSAHVARDNAPIAPQSQSFRHNGISRSYVVRAPRGLTRSSAAVPVVFVLHGGGGNAENAEKMTGFTALVERERLIVVYPEGTSRRARVRLLTWNAGHCCGFAMENRVDDVGFIGALLDTLGATYPVDASRIYVTGMSNGAMMSHRLGRELSPRIAAIAPVVGALFGDERPPEQPVSAIMINGLLDKSVPAEGGLTGGRAASQWDGVPTSPNMQQGAYWAKANDCATAPTKKEQGAVILSRYECPSGRRVELHQVKDNGHAWPSGERGSRLGDKPSTSLDATEVIWAFFKSVRKP